MYVGKEYTLKEIASTDDYVVSDEETKFTVSIESGETKLKVSEGNLGDAEVTEDGKGNYLLQARVEDEAKYTLIINKKNSENSPVSKVRFSLKGKGINTSVKTDEEGKLEVTGLYPGEKYELQETRADGYYTDEAPRIFTVKRDESGNLNIHQYDAEDVEREPVEDDVLKNAKIEDDEEKVQPTVTLNITNEKIPTYNLKIVKVRKIKKQKKMMIMRN